MQGKLAEVRSGVVVALGCCMALIAVRQPGVDKAQLPVIDMSNVVNAADHLDKTQ